MTAGRRDLPEAKSGAPWPVCHGLPMIYWPAGDDWACQDITCQFAHGMKEEQWQ